MYKLINNKVKCTCNVTAWGAGSMSEFDKKLHTTGVTKSEANKWFVNGYKVLWNRVTV